MYTAQSAIGVRLGLNKRWETIDLTSVTMAQLFAQFRRVQLMLLPAGANVSVYLDLSTVAAQFGTSPLTVQQALASIGSMSLPTTPTGLVLNNHKAYFADAFMERYSVTPVNRVNMVDPHVDTNTLPNVRLGNDFKSINWLYFFHNCLVNVNGFFHRIDTDGVNGVMVMDAMKCLVKSGQNQIGLWDFEDVGALTYVPITPGMIDQTGVAATATVTLPQDLTNKSVLLVLGGYLVQVDNAALSPVGGSSYRIDFSLLNIVDRYYESNNYLDLSSLNLPTASGNSQQIALSDLVSISAIQGWLALSQTFFVVVDAPEMYSQKLAVKSSGFPHLYTTYQVPSSPLVLELGRMPPYWTSEEDQQYSLSIYDNTVGNKLYYSNPLPSWLSTSGTNMPGMPGHLSRAYLLEIGRDV